jgi:hypothetical protein
MKLLNPPPEKVSRGLDGGGEQDNVIMLKAFRESIRMNGYCHQIVCRSLNMYIVMIIYIIFTYYCV